MSDAANPAQFARPEGRLITAGFNVESWLNDGQGVGTGGIFFPQRIHLPAGHH